MKKRPADKTHTPTPAKRITRSTSATKPSISTERNKPLKSSLTLMAANQIQARFDQITSHIQAINDQVNERFNAMDERFNAMDERLNAMNERLNVIDARREADKAREFNATIVRFSIHCLDSHFRALRKCIPGHPVQAGLPPRIDNVVFEQEYAIGDEPPPNLMPIDYRAVIAWRATKKDTDLVTLRRNLRGIYWFFNNGRLALADNANIQTCRAAIENLVNFMSRP